MEIHPYLNYLLFSISKYSIDFWDTCRYVGDILIVLILVTIQWKIWKPSFFFQAEQEYVSIYGTSFLRLYNVGFNIPPKHKMAVRVIVSKAEIH